MPRLLHRRSQHGYTDDPRVALFGEPEAVSADVQYDITARAHRSEADVIAHEWSKCSARVLGALDHFTSVTQPAQGVRSSLRAITRQVERIERDLTRG